MSRCLQVATFTAIVLCVVPRQSAATEQDKDLVVFEGACYYTGGTPSLKKSLPGVKMPEFRMLSTANYHGYRATWAVINAQLFLIGVEGKTKEVHNRMLKTPELFPGVSFPYQVTTFSGTIVLPGRFEDYIVREGTVTFTEKQVVRFQNGRVVEVTRVISDVVWKSADASSGADSLKPVGDTGGELKR